MTINLTELRDEPLGKHPLHATMCLVTCQSLIEPAETERVMFGAAADDEGVFKFDVDSLSDEPLDDSPSVSAYACCAFCFHSTDDGLSDEALDPRPAVNPIGCCVFSCDQTPYYTCVIDTGS